MLKDHLASTLMAREPSTRPCYSESQVALDTSRDGEFATFLVKQRRDLFPSVSQCFFTSREAGDRLQIQQWLKSRCFSCSSDLAMKAFQQEAAKAKNLAKTRVDLNVYMKNLSF